MDISRLTVHMHGTGEVARFILISLTLQWLHQLDDLVRPLKLVTHPP